MPICHRRLCCFIQFLQQATDFQLQWAFIYEGFHFFFTKSLMYRVLLMWRIHFLLIFYFCVSLKCWHLEMFNCIYWNKRLKCYFCLLIALKSFHMSFHQTVFTILNFKKLFFNGFLQKLLYYINIIIILL